MERFGIGCEGFVMQWLDISAYGAELKINTDALGSPALYVLENGDAIDFALIRAGFYRRSTGMWFRIFDLDDTSPILHSLVMDLPSVRVIEMSPVEIGLIQAPDATPEEYDEPQVKPSPEFPAIPPAAELAADADDFQPEEPPVIVAESGPVAAIIEIIAGPARPEGERQGFPWKLPSLGLFGRQADRPIRQEPSFEQAIPRDFATDWIVSTMAEDARELTGCTELPSRCHLVAKLHDPADANRLRSLAGTSVTAMGARGGTEIRLIAVVDGNAAMGLGSDGDVLLVGDPGLGFGAAVIPDPVEAGQAA